MKEQKETGDVEGQCETITWQFYLTHMCHVKVTVILFESNKRDSYKKVEVARTGDLNLQRSPSLTHSGSVASRHGKASCQLVEDSSSKGLGKNISHVIRGFDFLQFDRPIGTAFSDEMVTNIDVLRPVVNLLELCNSYRSG